MLWGGLLYSNLTPTPFTIHQHSHWGWEPIAVLWGGLLHSNLTPTPLIHTDPGVVPMAVPWGGLLNSSLTPTPTHPLPHGGIASPRVQEGGSRWIHMTSHQMGELL